MKNLIFFSFVIFFILSVFLSDAGSESAGERCYSDVECGFNSKCNNGVCIKKKEFTFGSSGKMGKPCNIDADCIGSGKCVKNNFNKGFCSGN